MALASNLISEFVKITKDDTSRKSEVTVYGTVVKDGESTYVRFDGAELLTPATSTTNVADGERVTVMIKNHSAVITGNITSPSARTTEVENTNVEVENVKILLANKVSTEELEAQIARIDTLEATNVIISGDFTAVNARIDDLEANDVEINGKLDANEASIKDLEAKDVTIKGQLSANEASIKDLEAETAEIKELTAKKLSADEAEVKYANIDFANIGEAALRKIFADSGLIKDLIVGDSKITGELVGVTIKGDLIEGNTVKADKLVVKGEDGLYYKLNFESGAFESADKVPTDSLHGSVITAHSITATQISVKDLVAFDATIGGFNISNDSLYSGVKSDANNTTRGIFLGNDGQIAFGDSSNFIKYFKDQNGNYKLQISAESITISAKGTSVETMIEDAQSAVNTVKDLEDRMNSGEFAGEDATTLRIDSSRGTVFKNSQVSTVLSAVIYYGSKRITDIDTLRATYGPGAYLEWSWQRIDEDRFGVISASDSRIGNNGFTLTIGADDVDVKVVFMCSLHT